MQAVNASLTKLKKDSQDGDPGAQSALEALNTQFTAYQQSVSPHASDADATTPGGTLARAACQTVPFFDLSVAQVNRKSLRTIHIT